MKSEAEKIENKQFYWLVTGFLIGSSTIFVPGAIAGTQQWLAIIFGMTEGIIFAFIYTSLFLKNVNKTLIEINREILGTFFGNLVSAVFLLYLFHLGTLVLGNLIDFIDMVVMPETPEIVFGALILLVCIFSAKKGLEVLTRCSVVLVPPALATLLFLSVLLLNKFKLINFMPLLDQPLAKLLWGAHMAGVYPFGEAVVFLIIIPYLKKPTKGRKSIILAILTAGIFFLITVVRNIGTMGVIGNVFIYPVFEAAKFVNLPFISIRMEIIVAINSFIMGFLKVAFLLYGSTLGTAQLFKLRDYQTLVIPIAILMLVFSIINFSNISENLILAELSYPIYALLFILGIPLVTLTVSIIKKLFGGEKN